MAEGNGGMRVRFHMGLLLIPDCTKNNWGETNSCLVLPWSPSYAIGWRKKKKKNLTISKKDLDKPPVQWCWTCSSISPSLSFPWIDIASKTLCLKINIVHILNIIYFGFYITLYSSLHMWLIHPGILDYRDWLSLMNPLYSTVTRCSFS